MIYFHIITLLSEIGSYSTLLILGIVVSKVWSFGQFLGIIKLQNLRSYIESTKVTETNFWKKVLGSQMEEKTFWGYI